MSKSERIPTQIIDIRSEANKKIADNVITNPIEINVSSEDYQRMMDECTYDGIKMKDLFKGKSE